MLLVMAKSSMSGVDPWTRGARIWIQDAEEDLAAALDSLSRPGALQPRHVSFFAQQAAEKALKAALTFSRAGGMEPTHDLALLVHALPNDGTWQTRQRYPHLGPLTSYGVDTRYLVNALVVTPEQARTACNLAKGIVGSCLRDMEAHGFVRAAQSVEQTD
jgi:HEPN domain-containing protein